MSASKMNTALNSVCNQITGCLSKQISEIFIKEVDAVRVKTGLAELVKQKESLTKRLKRMQTELSNINCRLNEQDGSSYGQLDDDVNLIFRHTQSSNRTKSAVQAVKNIMKTQPVLNMLNFEKIKENTFNMFNLAVTAKEKRDIILQLQPRDWYSIGVDIPQLPHFESFTVKGGKIVLPTTTALPKPTK